MKAALKLIGAVLIVLALGSFRQAENSINMLVIMPEFGTYQVNWKGMEMEFTGTSIVYEKPETGFGFLRIVSADGKKEIYKGLIFVSEGKSLFVDLRVRQNDDDLIPVNPF